MYVYDFIAIMLIGMSHILLYFELIHYRRLSYIKLIFLSIIFTILLGIVVTVTGYPEFNVIMFFFFLLSLGLMQVELTFMKNVYFTLASMVSITLLKMMLVEAGMMLFMWSPFNLYLWTASVINLIVSIIIVVSVWFLRNAIQKFAQFIVESPLYYFTYLLFVLGLVILFILTAPTTPFLAALHQDYGQLSYVVAIILFFILLLMVLISSHLTKEQIVQEQQERLDAELLDYVEKLEILHDELAGFRHDYVNVLLTLDEGVRTQNIKQVEKVYYDVIAPTSELINNREFDIVKLSEIQIPEVKSILSVKLIEAQQQNIQVMIDIPHTISEVTMPIVTFIRIISILLDNGIEEAMYSKEKMLQIAFFEMEDRQYFVVGNSSQHQTIDLEEIYEKRYSSKSANRGYGLYTVKNMIDKSANVTLETTFDAPLFTQTLIMKK